MIATLELLTEALAHHQAGRLAEAEAGYRRVLAEEPDNMDALHFLGALAHQAGRHAVALVLIGRAIDVNPGIADFHASLGTALKALGRLPEAAESYARALQIDADHPDALNNLGTVRTAQGRHADAEGCFRRALARNPDFPEALNNLGNALMGLGTLGAAEESFRRALDLRPDYLDAHLNLGNVLTARGRVDEGILSYRRALALGPDLPEAHASLANALVAAGRLDEAEAHARRAVAAEPGRAAHYLTLSNVLRAQSRVVEALVACRQALTLDPDSADGHATLGNALTGHGKPEEAVESYRRALALRPDLAKARSNLIFVLDFDPRVGSAEAFAERRRFNEAHARRLARAVLPHTNDPTPDRRLRIGYVSPDFREHSAAAVFGPVLHTHDREHFDVVCYSDVVVPDDRTARFQAAATEWRSMVGVSDADLAATIRADRIDILVDLAGHSSGNRLLVFARKPAPIQVTAWGHALGTGLDAMDYFFADRVTVPPEARAYFSEEVIELPAFVPYSPLDPAPAVTALPALDGGPITFGSFNRPNKVTPTTLALWAEILRDLPEARLLMKFAGLDVEQAQQEFRQAFAARGVSGDRVLFLGRTSQWDHLAAYGQVDLALDPFPHGGGVTALDGLWMGVPVVTLCGGRIPARMGASILTTLGLSEFIARTPDEYVARALRHARDREGLARLRATLRGRVRASILCAHPAYCRAVEAAYRAMWKRWCATGDRL